MGYVTPDAVRIAADPEWQAGSDQPASGGQSAAELSDGQLADAIAEASTRVDVYLAGRYTTPVAPVDPNVTPLTYPGPVAVWTRDIALYFATLTFLRGAPLEANDPVNLRYTAAMTDLAAARDGKLSLPLPAADVTPGSGFVGAVANGYVGLFDGSDAGYHRGAVSPGSYTNPPYPWLTGENVAWR